MSRDYRRQQAKLLRVERDLKRLAASMGAAGGVAATIAAADAATGKIAVDAHAEAAGLVLKLAELTAGAHDRLEAAAVEAGARLMASGTPKPPPSQFVESLRSLLGL